MGLCNMPAKTVTVAESGANPHTLPPSIACSEQWWRSAVCDPIASAPEVAGDASDSSSSDQLNGTVGSKDDLSASRSSGGLNNNDDDTSKDSQTTGSVQPGAP